MGSLQGVTEHLPGKLRCLCRLKRAHVRHSRRRGAAQKVGRLRGLCTALRSLPRRPLPDPQVPPGLEDGRLGLCLQGHNSQRKGCIFWAATPDLGPTPAFLECALGPLAPRPSSQQPGPTPATAWPGAGESTEASPEGAGGCSARAWKGANLE